ncbi:hypothetical protein C8R32_11915 [Nitrosospira sp. Nsp5]|uniref:Uncharacterized protein n=1 Tax=Nitrosospira multiformis TaxID=1231 RepID=A0ABY0TMD9_9PROT|nr:hypothetical protein C8R32_11915 [Nitrosospira sp. Nsp5]SDQ83397.1 hypothetical protein SAMN05216402_2477 [Nitrosospira multiformis]
MDSCNILQVDRITGPDQQGMSFEIRRYIIYSEGCLIAD